MRYSVATATRSLMLDLVPLKAGFQGARWAYQRN